VPLLYRIHKVTQARKYTVFPNMKTTFIAYCSMLLFCTLEEQTLISSLYESDSPHLFKRAISECYLNYTQL